MANIASTSAVTPADQHSNCLAERELRLAALDRTDARLGLARSAAAIAFVALFVGYLARHAPAPGWLLAPVLLFIASVLHHQTIRARRAAAQRAVQFHQRALRRLQGLEVAHGPGGEQFADPHHVYSADLDLFGPHGLYPRLCSARTPMGMSTLAQWLLAPASLTVIRARQAAIAELGPRVALREDLAVQGERERISLEPAALTDWALAPAELPPPGQVRWPLQLAAFLLPAAAAAAAAVWALWGFAAPLLAVLVLEAALLYAFKTRIHRCFAGIESAADDIAALAMLLRRIESEEFQCNSLRGLVRALSSHTLRPSVALAKLATTVNFVEARRNPLLTPLLLPLMYALHAAFAAERWRRLHGPAVAAWLQVLGEMEALISLAGHSFEHPHHTFPAFLSGAPLFRASQLGHPLLGAATCVRNDVDLSGATRVWLVSGSNMSGKSTLLRAVGINTVLAMAGATVCAARLELTPLCVGASIRVNDSLYEGSSRFYAEISRLRQLFELGDLPLLFLLDELLQGTNSADRLIGARGVLRALLARGAMGMISTHDLALADDAGLAPGTLRNVHFEDHLEGGRLHWDFRLREGVVTRSNGIELMRAIGLQV